ncbi:MAG: LPXTG cell wall anchor domain-containing protein, partial [Clostridiales bacterium]
NWGYQTCYGGADGEPVNMVANYYKPGPGTTKNKNRIAQADEGIWYVSDNFMEGSADVTKDNWKGVTIKSGKKSSTPWNAMPIRQQTAEEAYKTVLDTVGCSKPNRDSVDKRIIEEVRTGTATYGENGLITTPTDVGGWPALASGTAPLDSDHDGMPDSWETSNGLNPKDASDRNKKDSVGYTMLEKYINSDDLVSVTHDTAAVTDNSVAEANSSKDTTSTTEDSKTNLDSDEQSKDISLSEKEDSPTTVIGDSVTASNSDEQSKDISTAEEDLPKTGETSNALTIYIGLFMVLMGILFIIRKYKYKYN